MIQVTPVILCGGSGTRLWPLSRTGFPKQFLCLTGTDSLFQQAAQRLVGLGNNKINVASPLIVTGEDHRFLAAEQLREAGIPLGAALLEPVGRNTAPALTLAALAALQNGADPVLVVTPADQTVVDAAAFTAASQTAIEQAALGSIVILGVRPNSPETGYGYIQIETDGAAPVQAGVHTVKRFVEKPNAAVAKQYLNEGSYFWNAGMFVLKASVWLKALEQFRPDIYQATLQSWSHRSDDSKTDTSFVRPGKAEFTAIPSESVDYAVMERCPGSAVSIHMVPLNAGWSDLGAWDAVWSALPKDAKGNVHQGDVLATDTHNTLVHATSRLVSLVGVKDLIVIETPDAVLVADKTRSQDVKLIVTHLPWLLLLKLHCMACQTLYWSAPTKLCDQPTSWALPSAWLKWCSRRRLLRKFLSSARCQAKQGSAWCALVTCWVLLDLWCRCLESKFQRVAPLRLRMIA
jgi:mannose-1-phosphate guanylyltransferase/mannose-6-phosphate isomerase